MRNKYLQIFLLCLWGLLVLLNSRWIFYENFDKPYLLDLFHHSQWFVAGSDRIIADDLLYQVAAIKLNEGAGIYSINPEVPPLAKYFYVVTIQVSSNSYYLPVLLFIFSSIAFYLLAKFYFKDNFKSFLATLILMANPLYFFQIQQTMLDLPLLFFFILFLLFMLLFFSALDRPTSGWRKPKNIYILAAGVSLGLLSACKFPLFSPAILAITLFFLLLKKQFRASLLLVISSFLAYLLTHISYFLRGNSLFSWVGAQKWMLDFYLHQYSEKNIFYVFLQMITGWLKNSSGWSFSAEWTILWPIFIILLAFYLYQIIRTKRLKLTFDNYLILLLTSFYVLFLLASFTARYLLLALPIGILLLVKLKLAKRLLNLLLLILLAQAVLFMRRGPEKMLFFATEKWQRGDYQDMYYFFDQSSKAKISWQDFQAKYSALETNMINPRGEIKFIYDKVYPWTNYRQANVEAIIYGEKGKKQEIKQAVSLVRENGVWRLGW